jgi:hypothetical protein
VAGVAAGVPGRGQQQLQRRSTVEVAAVGGSANGSGPMVGLRGSGAGARRTTWEGVAFTAQEQAKLKAVKAALDANKQQVSRFEAQQRTLEWQLVAGYICNCCSAGFMCVITVSSHYCFLAQHSCTPHVLSYINLQEGACRQQMQPCCSSA